MKPAVQERVHTLIVPLAKFSLLVPSALIAEVVNITDLTFLPHGPKWMLGLLNWRSRPVPIVSFDMLLEEPLSPPNPRSKFVIFYPLEGRKPQEFVGILTASEPQPRTFTDATALSESVEHPSPLIAMALKLDKTLVGIPDLDKIRQLFYP